MSEVITPPGTIEPVFGLQIFTETTYVANSFGDQASAVQQDLTALSDDVVTAIDPTSTQYDYIVASGAGDDIVRLAAGDDVVLAGLGDDVVNARAGDDIVNGGAGDDILFGESGDDILNGGVGDDVLRGGEGDDVMRGGGGKDLLFVGPGEDIVTGGAGADAFRLTPGANVKLDTITDFDPTEDILQINRSLLPGSGLGNGVLSDADFAVVNSIGAGSDAKVVYESSTGLVYYNPGNGSPVALVQIDKGLSLDADAFRII